VARLEARRDQVVSDALEKLGVLPQPTAWSTCAPCGPSLDLPGASHAYLARRAATVPSAFHA